MRAAGGRRPAPTRVVAEVVDSVLGVDDRAGFVSVPTRMDGVC